MLRPLPPLPVTGENTPKDRQEPVPLEGRPVFYSSPPLRDGAVRNSISGVRPEWLPRKLSELPAGKDSTQWIWRGYLAPGKITSFTGLWKSGKTTLITNLIKGLDGTVESFAGQAVRPSKVLIVSEEDVALWAERRDDCDIGDHVSVISRPFLGKPRLEDWVAFIECVASQIDEPGYVVVFDSLYNLWPVKDENNASEVITALMPLYRLTNLNAAVLLPVHPKKGDAGEGQATRGSGAIGGFVDIIVEMRRFDAGRREDTRRVLTSYSRYAETPLELVIEFNPQTHEYSVIGSKGQVRALDRTKAVIACLPAQPPGLTPEEVWDAWSDEGTPRPGERSIRRDLDRALEAGTVATSGAGTRGDPTRYYAPPNPSSQAQNTIPDSSALSLRS